MTQGRVPSGAQIPMFALLALIACGPDHTEGKAEAVVSAAKEVAPAPTGATELQVDPAQSTLRATGAKVVGSHPIDFKEFTGTIGLEGDKVTSITFEVQMPSLVADDDRLTQHLMNEDFFDVGKFPTASFQATSIEHGEGTAATVTGNLTVHGMTKSVEFPATIVVAEGKVKASAQFVVDRQDFGIVYAGKADNLIQDKVAMEIAFVTK